jgi:hypothetical protein
MIKGIQILKVFIDVKNKSPELIILIIVNKEYINVTNEV